MSTHKFVTAKPVIEGKSPVVGTVALSTGIYHFNPADERENGRYQRSVLLTADAERAEKKGLVDIVGDATQADYNAWQIEITRADGGDADKLASELTRLAGDSSAAGNASLIAWPKGSPALDPGDGGSASIGAGRVGEEEELPEFLKLGVKKMPAELESVDDIEVLKTYYAAEAARPAPRATALEHIEARANALDNEAFDAWKAQRAEQEGHQGDAPPVG